MPNIKNVIRMFLISLFSLAVPMFFHDFPYFPMVFRENHGERSRGKQWKTGENIGKHRKTEENIEKQGKT